MFAQRYASFCAKEGPRRFKPPSMVPPLLRDATMSGKGSFKGSGFGRRNSLGDVGGECERTGLAGAERSCSPAVEYPRNIATTNEIIEQRRRKMESTLYLSRNLRAQLRNSLERLKVRLYPMTTKRQPLN